MLRHVELVARGPSFREGMTREAFTPASAKTPFARACSKKCAEQRPVERRRCSEYTSWIIADGEIKEVGVTWGVFCIETVWDRETNRSCRPLLEMMHGCWGMDFVCRSAVTKDEFFRHLRTWAASPDGAYPILYLGYHGSSGEIWLDEKEESAVENRVTVTDICDGIDYWCPDTVIHFGSCGTIDEQHAKDLFKQTGVSGVSGYRTDVEWIQSAAFELMYLELLQSIKSQDQRITRLNRRRVMACRKMLRSKPYGPMKDHLGFDLVAGDR